MCKGKKDQETKQKRTDEKQKEKRLKINPYEWIEKRFMEKR